MRKGGEDGTDEGLMVVEEKRWDRRKGVEWNAVGKVGDFVEV